MKYLLDSHTFLWYFLQPEELSAQADQILEDDSSELLLSVAAVWEIGIKYAQKKLLLPEPVTDYVRNRSQEANITLLPVLSSHVFRVITLPFLHKDPFDRIIVAQALEEGVSIISRDVMLSEYGAQRLW